MLEMRKLFVWPVKPKVINILTGRKENIAAPLKCWSVLQLQSSAADFLDWPHQYSHWEPSEAASTHPRQLLQSRWSGDDSLPVPADWAEVVLKALDFVTSRI